MTGLRLFLTALALLIAAPAINPAAADCLAPLAVCATDCDQRLRPEHPDRPQCARQCISAYQRCERIEQIQSNTGRPVLNQGLRQAPAR
jgi:hypothetical protein